MADNNNGILSLNEKHIEEEEDHKYLRVITKKYNSNQRKHRNELVEKSKKQVFVINEKLPIKVIMDCRTTSGYKFRARSVFKQYDVILTKKQSVLTKLMSSFEGENMQTKCNVLL